MKTRIFLAASCLVLAVHSLSAHVPVIVSHPLPPLRAHDGYFVTTAGDTVRGKIAMGQMKGFSKGIRIGQGKNNRFIPYPGITRIRIFARDSIMIRTPYTEFVVFENRPLRVLVKDKIEVYDGVLYTDERHGRVHEYVSVIDDGKLVSSANFWGLSTKKELVAFVNKRYHQEFTVKDFRDPLEIIRYIALNG